MGLPENERLKEGYAAPREGRRAVAAAFCTEDKLLPHVAAHVLAAQHRLLDFRTPVVGEGHQAALGKVAVGTEGRLAHVLLDRSEEHTSELQSLMRISYAVFCLKKKKT